MNVLGCDRLAPTVISVLRGARQGMGTFAGMTMRAGASRRPHPCRQGKASESLHLRPIASSSPPRKRGSTPLRQRMDARCRGHDEGCWACSPPRVRTASSSGAAFPRPGDGARSNEPSRRDGLAPTVIFVLRGARQGMATCAGVTALGGYPRFSVMPAEAGIYSMQMYGGDATRLGFRGPGRVLGRLEG